MHHPESVRQYYEANTRRFLKWGADERTRNIHGALWPEGVEDLATAMDYSNELVLEAVRTAAVPVTTIIDMGCGVGRSLGYLSERLPDVRQFVGITISESQATLAREHQQDKRLRFISGNFLEARHWVDRAEVIFSIEAFAHTDDAQAFFAETAHILPPGGRLVLIDDVVARAPAGKRERFWLDRYRQHWLLPGLHPMERLLEMAQAHSLQRIHDQDLTPWLRIGRPRDRLVRLASRIAGRWLRRSWYGKALVGGDAKQYCYRLGLVRYRLLIFEKTDPKDV